MTYWELETEAWELYPDDHYDGAHYMTLRGRRETLERSFDLDYERTD